MKSIIRLAGILAMSVGLVALENLPASTASAADRPGTITIEALNSQLAGGYGVASGDKLRVNVFGEPTLTGEYTIGVSGELGLPLIESIRAGGLNTAELAETIAAKLSQGGYVLNPRVSIEILEHRPFYILGEVKLPGEYPYSGDLTLEQAVAKAGGYTPRANRKMVTIRRQKNDQEYRVKLDRSSLKIAPGDTIVVKEAFI